jgi:hypothetical protein
MKSYEKQIEEFGKEIADEVVLKEKNYKYEIFLDRYEIARSLSSIHSEDLRKTTEDLDKSIDRSLSRIRIQNQY